MALTPRLNHFYHTRDGRTAVVYKTDDTPFPFGAKIIPARIVQPNNITPELFVRGTDISYRDNGRYSPSGLEEHPLDLVEEIGAIDGDITFGQIPFQVGDFYTTRNGSTAQIIAITKDDDDEFPIAARINPDSTPKQDTEFFCDEGWYYGDNGDTEHPYDLFEYSHTNTVNTVIPEVGHLFITREGKYAVITASNINTTYSFTGYVFDKEPDFDDINYEDLLGDDYSWTSTGHYRDNQTNLDDLVGRISAFDLIKFQEEFEQSQPSIEPEIGNVYETREGGYIYIINKIDDGRTFPFVGIEIDRPTEVYDLTLYDIQNSDQFTYTEKGKYDVEPNERDLVEELDKYRDPNEIQLDTVPPRVGYIYRTRNNSYALITGIIIQNEDYPFTGIYSDESDFSSGIDTETWTNEGTRDSDFEQHDYDLVEELWPLLQSTTKTPKPDSEPISNLIKELRPGFSYHINNAEFCAFCDCNFTAHEPHRPDCIQHKINSLHRSLQL